MGVPMAFLAHAVHEYLILLVALAFVGVINRVRTLGALALVVLQDLIATALAFVVANRERIVGALAFVVLQDLIATAFALVGVVNLERIIRAPAFVVLQDLIATAFALVGVVNLERIIRAPAFVVANRDLIAGALAFVVDENLIAAAVAHVILTTERTIGAVTAVIIALNEVVLGIPRLETKVVDLGMRDSLDGDGQEKKIGQDVSDMHDGRLGYPFIMKVVMSETRDLRFFV